MIESRSAVEPSTTTGTKPEQITTTMIINDLENGIDRDGIKNKYSLEAWEVKQMFMHPTLKGKKAKKVRKLSFEFVDDTQPFADPNQTSIPVEDVPPTMEETYDLVEEQKAEEFEGSFDEDESIEY
tara:strand:- start:21 stop:398 length:378 start_codon:yes stop_codon:yes gene_type:complete